MKMISSDSILRSDTPEGSDMSCVKRRMSVVGCVCGTGGCWRM